MTGRAKLDHFTLYFIRQNSVKYACTSCSVMKGIPFISDTFPSRSFLLHFYVLLKEQSSLWNFVGLFGTESLDSFALFNCINSSILKMFINFLMLVFAALWNLDKGNCEVIFVSIWQHDFLSFPFGILDYPIQQFAWGICFLFFVPVGGRLWQNGAIQPDQSLTMKNHVRKRKWH